MARINFRQGIVSHQTDTQNNPVFLDVSGSFVDLVVSPDPTVIAFIQGDADYLYTESVSASQAWGPFTANTAWLFWDLNAATGNVTRGATSLEPIESPKAPTNPAVEQMWYNTLAKRWYVWSGAAWREVVRVFAARLENGSVLRSMSINAPSFKGTQVGITTPTRAGSLVFDQSGKPVRVDGRFFTTEDQFVTGVPTGASLRVANIIVTGQAQSPLAAYQVVQYNDFNKIGSANPFQQGLRLFGIIEEDAVTNEVVNFVTEGMIFNEAWDWVTAGASANTPVYVSPTGTITTNAPGANVRPVGVVIGRQEILFAPQLFPQVAVVAGGGGGQAGATPTQVAQINQNSTDIDSLETSQNTQDGRLDGVEGRLDTIEPIVSGHTTQINDLDTAIVGPGGVSERLDDLEAFETNQGTTNTSLTQAIADNVTALGTKVESVVAGTNVTVDDTDPLNPIVSAPGDSRVDDLVSDAPRQDGNITELAKAMLPFSFQDVLPAQTVVARFIAPVTLYLNDAENHVANAAFASASSGGTIEIKINGTTVGTISWAVESSQTAVVSITTDSTLSPGDILTLETTLGFDMENAAVTLVLNRNITAPGPGGLPDAT